MSTHVTLPLEEIPPQEAEMIEQVKAHTLKQMMRRYEVAGPVLRGVHPKDHGCVRARFTVNADLPAGLRVGVFAEPGRTYAAWIRFSNAALRAGADSASKGEHGSRGMAVKLMNVGGQPLLPGPGPHSQDFLMINQPVFAFANVEDYLALNEVLTADGDENPGRFFKERIPRADGDVGKRAKHSLEIVTAVRSGSSAPPYQALPASPVDNAYFSGSAFLFGEGRAMKFCATPRKPSLDPPDTTNRDYLRTALHQRLTAPEAAEIVFDFQLQVRTAAELAGKLATEIENASCLWTDPPVPVATITIAPQDFETPERIALGESLTFTPWHGLVEHRPLGGINRLRLAVYEASTQLRHMPPEPPNP